MSLLITRSFTGQVKGLKEFPREDQPPVILPYFAFRVMLAVGFGLLLLMLWTVWAWRKGRLTAERVGRQKWLLRAWVAAIPAGYVAVETGWIIREVGRQPWVIYGHLRTADASSLLPASAVASTLAMYLFIYSSLLAIFLVFARRIIAKGPDLNESPPYYQDAPSPSSDASQPESAKETKVDS